VLLAFPEPVWVSCPQCGERIVNLAGLRSGRSAPLSCLVALVFVLTATLAPLFAIALVAVLLGLLVMLGLGPDAVTREAPLMVLFGALSCLAYGLLLYAGVLSTRAERATEGRGPRIVAAVCALVLFGMLVAVLLFLVTHMRG
jgi:hypothetical protein